jgi:hypothetical protein
MRPTLRRDLRGGRPSRWRLSARDRHIPSGLSEWPACAAHWPRGSSCARSFARGAEVRQAAAGGVMTLNLARTPVQPAP